jgi:hypothetical protein
LHLPAGLPASVAEQVRHLAEAVFIHGFVDAMRPTLILPIAVPAVAGVGCFAVKGGVTRPEAEAADESVAAMAAV